MRVLASISAGETEIFSGRLDIRCDSDLGCPEWMGWPKLAPGEESDLVLWIDESVLVTVESAGTGAARVIKTHTRAGVHLPREAIVVDGLGACPLLAQCEAETS